jgi:antitoxin component YwqK of YwqJK toxin-antitoxin module
MKLKIIICLITLIIIMGCTKEQKEYYTTGEVFATYKIQNGQKDGMELKYYKSGKLLSESQWKAGLIIDKVIHYYESGDTLEIQQWEKGKKQGKTIQFYPNGVLRHSINFANDKRVGKTVYYRKDSTIEKMDTYDSTGKLTHSYNYDQKGKLVDQEPFLILEPDRDTLLVDQNNKFEARFINYDTLTTVGFHFGPLTFRKQYVELQDTLDIVEKVDNQYFVHLILSRKEFIS